MNQIMRLRRISGNVYDIKDRNNGERHEMAFVKNIQKNGVLHEADLLPDSYGGKFHPRAVPELISSLPVVVTALLRGKVTPQKALLHSHKAPEGVKEIFESVESRDGGIEFNLYIEGTDEDNAEPPGAEGVLEKVAEDVVTEALEEAPVTPAGGEGSSA